MRGSHGSDLGCIGNACWLVLVSSYILSTRETKEPCLSCLSPSPRPIAWLAFHNELIERFAACHVVVRGCKLGEGTEHHRRPSMEEEVTGRRAGAATTARQAGGDLVPVPHVALLCSCPFILFSEQENSCALSSNGLFSTINLFFSLLFPSKMTQIILAFGCSEYCNALPMWRATAQRTDLACTRAFK